MSSTIELHLNNLRKYILKFSIVEQHVAMIEEKTKVNIEYFVVAAGAILVLMLFTGFQATFVANSIGFLYPAYASILAVESKEKDDDTQWLMYWVVFALFSTVENFASIIVYWIPFFYPLKTSVLLWCMLPQFKGSVVVYENIIQPAFAKHESTIDAALNGALGAAAGAASAATSKKSE